MVSPQSTSASGLWQAYAVKYAERNARTRAESFMFDDHAALPHGMDYSIWLLRSGPRTIVVDTGYDASEAKRRQRPILREPAEALKALDIDAAHVTDVIITHLHYDHAGGLSQFPNATFHLQATEMAYATGPCMCHGTLQMPYTAEHVCEMVKRVYSGRVVFYEGSGEVAPGLKVHRLGGHARGLQIVEVATEDGPLILASDAAHYYENLLLKKPFPIVVDMEDMMRGFDTLLSLAASPNRIIPGHDPLVAAHFPTEGRSGFVWRLDKGPFADIPSP
ncbi:MAG: N-acyl homoserine lactonase family protein [Pseudomonadota bacterium]